MGVGVIELIVCDLDRIAIFACLHSMDCKEQLDASLAQASTAPRVFIGPSIVCPWLVNRERIESYMEFEEVTTSDVFLWAFVHHHVTLKRPVSGYPMGKKFRAAIVDVSRETVFFVSQGN